MDLTKVKQMIQKDISVVSESRTSTWKSLLLHPSFKLHSTDLELNLVQHSSLFLLCQGLLKYISFGQNQDYTKLKGDVGNMNPKVTMSSLEMLIVITFRNITGKEPDPLPRHVFISGTVIYIYMYMCVCVCVCVCIYISFPSVQWDFFAMDWQKRAI